MNGFSTKRFFDSENLKKGMLITATYRTGIAKSGLISNVTPDNLQFTYFDALTANFQNEEVSIEQVESASVILTFANHLTEVVQEKKQSSTSTKQTEKEDAFANASIDELLRKNFTFDKLEQFLKRQRDERVIAFILSRLNIPQNEFAKLLFALPDSISLNVQKQLDNLTNLNPEMKKTLEEQVIRIVREYLRSQQNQNQNQEQKNGNPFGGGFGGFGDGKNPLEDLLGGLGGNNGEMQDMLQDMAKKAEDVFRKFFNDNDNNNRPF